MDATNRKTAAMKSNKAQLPGYSNLSNNSLTTKAEMNMAAALKTCLMEKKLFLLVSETDLPKISTYETPANAPLAEKAIMIMKISNMINPDGNCTDNNRISENRNKEATLRLMATSKPGFFLFLLCTNGEKII